MRPQPLIGGGLPGRGAHWASPPCARIGGWPQRSGRSRPPPAGPRRRQWHRGCGRLRPAPRRWVGGGVYADTVLLVAGVRGVGLTELGGPEVLRVVGLPTRRRAGSTGHSGLRGGGQLDRYAAGQRRPARAGRGCAATVRAGRRRRLGARVASQRADDAALKALGVGGRKAD